MDRVLNLIFAAAIINFVVFCVVSLFIGGDALNGHAADGHYYLANHGRLTEVSHAVFIYSQWHAISLFVTHPLGMLAGFVGYQRRKKIRASAH